MCERWVYDPYFQYFTGEEFFQHAFPHERSDLSHWRGRLGAKLELLLAESLRVAQEVGALRTRVATAVNASAACANASAGVGPNPRTPTSASWGKCSHRARLMADGTVTFGARVFPKKLNGRRLGAPFSFFLGKCHARADLPLRERIGQHAVAVEIDLLSITGLEETELAGQIDSIRPFRWAGPRDVSLVPARGAPGPGVACGRA